MNLPNSGNVDSSASKTKIAPPFTLGTPRSSKLKRPSIISKVSKHSKSSNTKNRKRSLSVRSTYSCRKSTSCYEVEHYILPPRWNRKQFKSIWQRLASIREMSLKQIRDNWYFQPAENFLLQQMSRNPIYPFVYCEPSVFAFSSVPSHLGETIVILIGLLIFCTLRILYSLQRGIDDYIVFAIISCFALAFRLAWYVYGRTIIIDHNSRCYEYYRGKTLVYRGHLHNLFVQIRSIEIGSSEYYFKLILSGYLVEEFDLCKYSLNGDKIKSLGRAIAKRLDLNFIDHKRLSRQHVVRHLCPYFVNNANKPFQDDSGYEYLTMINSIEKDEYFLSSFSKTLSENSEIEDAHQIQNERSDEEEDNRLLHLKKVITLQAQMEAEQNKQTETDEDFLKLAIDALVNEIAKETFVEEFLTRTSNKDNKEITVLKDEKLVLAEMFELFDYQDIIDIERQDSQVGEEILSNCEISSNTVTYTVSKYNFKDVSDSMISTLSSYDSTTSTNSSAFRAGLDNDIIGNDLSTCTQFISSSLSSSFESDSVTDTTDDSNTMSTISTDVSWLSKYPSKEAIVLPNLQIYKTAPGTIWTQPHQIAPLPDQDKNKVISLSTGDYSYYSTDDIIDVSTTNMTFAVPQTTYDRQTQWITDTFTSGKTLDSFTNTLITTYTFTYDPTIEEHGDLSYPTDSFLEYAMLYKPKEGEDSMVFIDEIDDDGSSKKDDSDSRQSPNTTKRGTYSFKYTAEKKQKSSNI